MPWNRIYYPEGAFSKEDKDAIAKGITDIYARNYPRGSVLVAFFPIEKGEFFKGGEAVNNYVRISLQHLRGSYSTYELENVVRTQLRDVWKPFIPDRGLGYELQIDEIEPEQVSLDNYVSNTLLGEPLYKEIVETGVVFPLKRVKA